MENSEDKGNLETGDLGLGRGLRPGAIERYDQTEEEYPKPNRTILSVQPTNSNLNNAHIDTDIVNRTDGHEDQQPFHETEVNPNGCSDVQLGKSLRQQKILYEHDLDEIIKKHTDLDLVEPTKSVPKKATTKTDRKQSIKGSSDEEKVYKLLSDAQQEIEVLRQDLELCQRQLHSKYKAIEILQKQAFKDGQVPLNLRETVSITPAPSRSIRRSQLMNKRLHNEIQKLQFELEYRQSTMMNSQELWAERFDRVCRENLSLGSELELRNDNVRKLVSEKMVLARERDELLALLDIQERQQYEANRSQSSSEDGYFDFTSNELAILGACHCRGMEPEPCGCAHSAVSFRRDVIRLKEELQRQKERTDEALITTDAYRMAFEGQLSRNSSLLRKMAELSNPPNSLKQMSQSKKVKAALKWLLEQFNEDDSTIYKPTQLQSLEELESQEDEQLVLMLVDMVCDKSEALAHQRLATRMLANKTKELEKRLQATGGGHADEVFREKEATACNG